MIIFSDKKYILLVFLHDLFLIENFYNEYHIVSFLLSISSITSFRLRNLNNIDLINNLFSV